VRLSCAYLTTSTNDARSAQLAPGECFSSRGNRERCDDGSAPGRRFVEPVNDLAERLDLRST
jgi:hypothetical protein